MRARTTAARPAPRRKAASSQAAARSASKRETVSSRIVSVTPEHTAEDYASAASLFRALSHPLRVQLVCGLLQEPRSQTGIARALGLSQSLVAQHLAVLRRSGIVRGTRQGGEVVLEVSDPRLPGVFAAVCGDAAQVLSLSWEKMATIPALRELR